MKNHVFVERLGVYRCTTECDPIKDHGPRVLFNSEFRKCSACGQVRTAPCASVTRCPWRQSPNVETPSMWTRDPVGHPATVVEGDDIVFTGGAA